MIFDSEKETLDFAKDYASKLKGGETIILTGDLGAGKTTFVRGFAAAFGAEADVSSPTFTLMRIYEGTKIIHHFDLYRLKSEQEVLDLGFQDFVDDPKSIALVEWGERFMDVMPEDAIHIRMQNMGGEKRELQISEKR